VVVALAAVGILYALEQGGSRHAATKASTTKAKTTSASRPATSSSRRAAAAPCRAGPPPATRHYAHYPPMVITPGRPYTARVCTDVGAFTISLDSAAAPRTVNNFVFLAEHDFYNGLIFHRVIPGFVVQGGDPNPPPTPNAAPTGPQGPGYEFADELPKPGSYKLGSVAMANSGPNTNGSQFFIVVGPQGEALPPDYSLFGQVSSGMSVVERIAADGSPSGQPRVVHRILDVTISSP
jgi:cyclophilin family peptidyl-prolyl cis-trans isomerase